MSIEVCDGNVIGAVAYACENRLPSPARRARFGVIAASTTSARVVSSVTSKIEGRSTVVLAPTLFSREQPHVLATIVNATTTRHNRLSRCTTQRL
ncbi:MAG TPA: hypothetical protein VN811_07740 [Thermoanaerobaculia bacterium]|nr:hypothetical protein [Thermoanaerobaculia bacterium]